MFSSIDINLIFLKIVSMKVKKLKIKEHKSRNIRQVNLYLTENLQSNLFYIYLIWCKSLIDIKEEKYIEVFGSYVMALD